METGSNNQSRKTQYLILSRKNLQNSGNHLLQTKTGSFNRVKQFEYIESVTTDTRKIDTEIKTRSLATRRASMAMNKILGSRTLSISIKLGLDRTGLCQTRICT